MNEPHSELKNLSKRLPKSPGVYLMKDSAGEVIYVGKAVDLRARVNSYLRGGDGRSQIEYLLARLHDVETIVTETERQAFVLERDLITKLKPRYNIRLKDDKAYLNVRIDNNQEWPRLELVRKVESDGALYFGPYTFSYELRQLLDTINRVVPLRTCSDTVFHNRQRPCLEYQIKRCAGPCCLEVDRDEYAEWLEQAIKILEGKNRDLVSELTARMERASEELRFEEAATLRDRIELLQRTSESNDIVSHKAENRDVFGYYREGTLLSVEVLFVRNGRVSGNKSFTFSEVAVSDQELIESIILQFYTRREDAPGEVLVPFEFAGQSFVEEILRDRAGHKVPVVCPQRGLKQRLAQLAQLNAKHHFIAKFNASDRYAKVAEELRSKFGLSQAPRRIECVDISNFQASDIVAGLVSFFDGSPDKKSYKRYILEHTGKPDDFACIEEVVTRRLRRGKREDNLPDLLVIDGGRGQLSAALKACEAAEVELDIVSIAKIKPITGKRGKLVSKKPERVFTAHVADSLPLPAHGDLTHFLQRLRDETHRFAITFHRGKRDKRVFESVLDTIPGIGPERRARLLRTYGSVKAMRGVKAEELASKGRLPKLVAKKLFKALNANQFE